MTDVRAVLARHPTWAGAAFALGYFGLALAGLQFLEPGASVAAVWPASGFGLAVLSLTPPRRWPPLVAFLLVGDLAAQAVTRGEPDAAALLALCNALETVLAAGLLRRIAGGTPSFDHVRHVGGLIVAAALGNGVSSLLAGLVTSVAFGADYLSATFTWWLSDGLGMLALTPLAVVVWQLGGVEAPTAALPERLIGIVVGIPLVAVVLLHPQEWDLGLLDYPYLLFPLLVWATVRLGRATGCAIVAVVGTVAGMGLVHDLGPFVRVAATEDGSLYAMQAFVAVTTVTVLLLGALMRERHDMTVALADSEELHRLLVANLPGTLVVLFDVDLTCEMLEGPLVARRGMDRPSLVGRTFDSHLNPAAEADVRPRLEAALRGEASSMGYEAQDGLIGELDFVPRRDAAGQVVGVYTILRDVTAQRAAEAHFRSLFASAPVGIAVIAEDGRVVDANPALEAILSASRERLVGARVADLLPERGAEGLLERLAALFEVGRGTEEAELHTRDGQGRELVLSLHLSVLEGIGGEPARVLCHLLDVTNRAQVLETLRHQADHDVLTGLANRRVFERAYARHVARHRPAAAPGAVLLVDIDDFKRVNDSFGHAMGDALIGRVARTLRGGVRATDVVARLGGDEFGLLLGQATQEDAEAIARELVLRMREAGGRPGDAPVTVSIGVAAFAPAGVGDAGDALEAADRAMYEAKQAGRDGFAVARPSAGDRLA